MTILINILLFVLILSVIVAIHEFGHFIFAKINGVYVYEYAIGMGPKLFSYKPKNSETEYTIRAIPLGGFCSLAGEDVEGDDLAKVAKEKRLQAKKPWQRFLIMFMGPGFNFILAFTIILFVSLVWGSSTYEPIIDKVKNNTPAATVGIEKNDKIINIDGHKINTTDDVSLYLTLTNKKKPVKITVEKINGTKKTYSITPKKIVENNKTKYIYGIAIKSEKTKGLFNAFKYTFVKMGSLFRQMVETVKALFTGRVSVKELSGPVGIYSIVGKYAKSGVGELLFLMAFLSINVGFLNLLPFPAFDGGHILFIIIEMVARKPVKPEIENIIHTIGLVLLLLLMVYVTINDILRLF